TARVLHGGLLTSHKGINLPGVSVSAPSITEKDREDVAFAVEQGVDYLALSFVRRAQDIAELRAMIPREILVIAKIEKDSALENIESIVRASDGIMVARGDLGGEQMNRISAEVERSAASYRRDGGQRSDETAMSTEFAIAAACNAASRMLRAPCLIVFTKSGFSSRVVASQRPSVPILVLTDQPRTYRQLALVWGVVPELVPHCNTYDEMVRIALE